MKKSQFFIFLGLVFLYLLPIAVACAFAGGDELEDVIITKNLPDIFIKGRVIDKDYLTCVCHEGQEHILLKDFEGHIYLYPVNHYQGLEWTPKPCSSKQSYRTIIRRGSGWYVGSSFGGWGTWKEETPQEVELSGR